MYSCKGLSFSTPDIVFISLIILIALGLSTTGDLNIFSVFAAPLSSPQNITLTAILDDLGDKGRWTSLFENALKELEVRHPGLDIKIDYKQIAYPNERTEFLKAMANQTPVDLMSADQIWVGEFAKKGLFVDLTNRTKAWGRSSDWYEVNWDGGAYGDKIYAIWLWTDVRGIYYWKDLLNEAKVDPNSLVTWNGYIDSAKKLNSVLRSKGIEGVHLTGASHSPDLWYPYLWMLGGDIVGRKSGHPTEGIYWFPIYNSSAGIKALQFLKDQVSAGIKPQKEHFWGQEFADRKFSVMIEASHVPLYFPAEQRQDLKQKIGYLPLPLPDKGHQPATMMGGWELGIPKTSQHKDLAWELITISLEPKTFSRWLERYGYLPTQLPIGEGIYSSQLEKSNPFYHEMISLIPTGLSRPSIPEYPQITDHIRQAIDQVYYGLKEPKEALDEAAAKSAISLGWKNHG
jgi:multiple sugar transport system substrate-binding protein